MGCREEAADPPHSAISKPLLIEPEAEGDLRHAFRWYEQHRAGLGDDFLLCFEAALSAIQERPRSFPVVGRKTRRVLLRRFPYFVLCIELSDAIPVIGVFHTSRDPRRWRKRLR